MTFAADMGWGPHPRIKAPRQGEGRTPCPLPAEVERFRAAMSQQHRAWVVWLYCTGCRRGETNALDWSDVDLAGAKARLWADTTKAGRSRMVKLLPACVAALSGLPHREGRVFGEVDRRSAWRRACRDAKVTLRGPHDLRHGWASWHYAIHRDLLLLRTDGGWHSTEQVERYAHLMPAGHEAGIRRLWGIRSERGRIRA